jgi:hypothetical protein
VREMSECKYRVWCIVNPPSEPLYYYVPTPRIGAYIIEALPQWQLLDEAIYENVFGVQVYAPAAGNLPAEWIEWENEDGEDFEVLSLKTSGPWVRDE